MSRGEVHEAIDRWQATGLVDAATAGRLRADVARHADASARRLSQYVLAFTGAVVLVTAGGVFLDWAWPLLGERGRTLVLGVIGLGVLGGGIGLERSTRWLPAGLLMQTAGVALLLSAYVYSERAWSDQTLGGSVIGLFALATPIVLTARAMRSSAFMPAVHMAAGLAFLAVFLDRTTSLSGDAIVWVLDLVLVGAIAVFVRVLLGDPDGQRHPWALNAFVLAMGGGFVLVALTVFETLHMSEDGLLALDAWLLLSAGVTLWGAHLAPPGLRRSWFGVLLSLEMLAWIGLGLLTVDETFGGPPELAIALVGGAGVLAFMHADRHGLRALMAAASLAFIVPVWWWAVERGGALGGIAALVGTAAFLFWASGRREQLFKAE
jgi:uncharacterized membrane protein